MPFTPTRDGFVVLTLNPPDSSRIYYAYARYGTLIIGATISSAGSKGTTMFPVIANNTYTVDSDVSSDRITYTFYAMEK